MGFKENFIKAFAVSSPEFTLTPEDQLLLQELAVAVVRRGLASPAILFLEGVKPLSFLGSQAMVFFGPIVTMVFRNQDRYNRLTNILDKRSSLNFLIEKIDEFDQASAKRRKE